jgi:hypothetical protein
MGLPPSSLVFLRVLFSFIHFFTILLFSLIFFLFVFLRLLPLFSYSISSYLSSYVHFFLFEFLRSPLLLLFISSLLHYSFPSLFHFISSIFFYLSSYVHFFFTSFLLLLFSILYINYLPPLLSFMQRPTNVSSGLVLNLFIQNFNINRTHFSR